MIRDTDNNPISSYHGTLSPDEEFLCTVHIDCTENTKLSAFAVDDITIEARHGVSGGFTDITTTPIDLEPYAPAREIFQIKITGGSSLPIGRKTFGVTVGP